jgi:hypothetical protein
MKKEWFVKTLALGIVVLFISVAFIPSIGVSNYLEDNTPPVTTCTLDPPYPDGLNGWYVNDVNVTLNATDDLSGVKEIYYRVAEGEWKNSSGDYVKFILDYDCLINDFIEFYAVDFAGNQEEIKSFCCIDMDQQPPEYWYHVDWEICRLFSYKITIHTGFWDNCSGVERFEFLINDVLQETITGPGPSFSWCLKYFPIKNFIIKIICYDMAGNKAVLVINSDIHPRFRSVNQYLEIEWILRFFYRYPLIQQILNILGWFEE